MSYKLRTILLPSLLLVSCSLFSQEIWTLERCINYANENNITIRQAKANVRTAALTKQQAKESRLPSLRANVDFGEQFGRTIDPTSNQFSTDATSFSSIGLSGGVNVFSGGIINHSIKQANWNLQAAIADAERSINDLGLLIASAYLNILLSEEQLNNAGKRVEQSQAQLAVTQKLIDAGTAPAAEKFNLLAQVARDEQIAVQARNNVDLAYLTLKQYLQLEPDYNLQVQRPDILIPADARPEEASLTTLYQTALTTQPGIRAAGFRVNSAKEGIAIAKSAYYPTLSVFANLNSSYSSRFLDFQNGTIVRQDTIPAGSFLVNGQPLNIQAINDVYSFPKLGYFNQIDRNFGQGFGISLGIPIYQNGRTRLSVERARLSALTAEMQQTQTQQTLKNDIQTAIANARAAKRQLDAAQKTFDATSLAYQNTEKRLALGAVNTLDLTTSKNNRDIAENDLAVARYDYLFKLKILDFYAGRPLKLD